MSYILDALAKSQQQRELGRVPTLAGAPTAGATVPAGRSPWPAAALLLSVAALLVAAYGALHGTGTVREPVPAPVAPPAQVPSPAPAMAVPDDRLASPAPPPPAAAARPPPAPPPAPNAPRAAPARLAAPPGAAIVAPPSAPSPRAPAAAVAAPAPAPADPLPGASGRAPGIAALRESLREAALPAPVPAPSVPAAAPDGAGADEPPLLARLPPQARARVPEMTVNVHVYHPDPAERYAYINMRRYRAGQRTSDGVLVEAVTRDGLVLEFEGTRFRVRTRDD